LWGNARFRALVLSRWFIPAAYVVALGLSWRFRPSLLLGATATNVVIALVIERCVRCGKTGVVGRVLNWTPIVFIGTLSYSLYLWQQLFINRDSSATISAFPLNLVLALLAATASYYAVELPMLRARLTLARRMQGSRQRATTAPSAPAAHAASTPDASSGSHTAH
jgi:peptidoglycan/LPS O-acetylase OafA/YrhL